MKSSRTLLLGLGAALAAVVVVVLVITAGGSPDPGGRGRDRTPTTGGPTGPTTDAPTGSPAADPRPLGSIQPDAFDQGDPCPAGHECRQFSVSCPEVGDPARVAIAIAPPAGELRGTAAFFSGGGGRQWWADEGSTGAFIQDVRDAGLTVVQIRWKDEWLGAVEGDRAGPHRLACRSATVIDWIHREVHERSDPPEAEPGRCGFCLTGASGGASQITYAMAFYGIDSIVDGLFPSGGPPHAALDKGCLRNQDEDEFWYEGASVRTIDASWGFRAEAGPCVNHDEGFLDQWLEANVETGGNDYAHEATRVVIIIGERDRILPHGQVYQARLNAEGTDSRIEIVPGMGHSIAASPDGLAVLLELLTA